jgi:hypothetical protein
MRLPKDRLEGRKIHRLTKRLLAPTLNIATPEEGPTS